jgi:methionyl-tRNA formyltransferase
MAYVIQFVPQELCKIPKHGTIQYHPSLLPKYRGPSAINWAIALGEEKTGLTIFRPSDGLDEGEVILQKEVAIGPNDTLGKIYFDHLFPIGVNALLEAADLVVAGKHQEIVQDESQANYEGWFDANAAQIHWATHISQIYNLIRACNPARCMDEVWRAKGSDLRLPQARSCYIRRRQRQTWRSNSDHA